VAKSLQLKLDFKLAKLPLKILKVVEHFENWSKEVADPQNGLCGGSTIAEQVFLYNYYLEIKL
jgi:hypothetical protein